MDISEVGDLLTESECRRIGAFERVEPEPEPDKPVEWLFPEQSPVFQAFLRKV